MTSNVTTKVLWPINDNINVSNPHKLFWFVLLSSLLFMRLGEPIRNSGSLELSGINHDEITLISNEKLWTSHHFLNTLINCHWCALLVFVKVKQVPALHFLKEEAFSLEDGLNTFLTSAGLFGGFFRSCFIVNLPCTYIFCLVISLLNNCTDLSITQF